MRVAKIRRLSRICFEENVQSRFYVGALDELQAYRELGRKVVLVSAGPRYLISVIGEWIGVDDCITAGPLLQDNRVTDTLDGPLCSGQGKVDRVMRYLVEHGIEPEQCVYYGDSINDLPLLNAVGEAVVVNPDPRLYRIALSRGWRILRFSKTTGKDENPIPSVTVNRKEERRRLIWSGRATVRWPVGLSEIRAPERVSKTAMCGDGAPRCRRREGKHTKVARRLSSPRCCRYTKPTR